MRSAFLLLALGLAGFAGCISDDGDKAAPSSSSSSTAPATGLHLAELAVGLDLPLYALPVPGASEIAVVEQGGLVRLLRNGTLQTTPFLDLTGRTDAAGEQGLLGFAFHPDYTANGVVIASYTDSGGTSILSRLKRLADGSGIDAASEEVLLRVQQPFANHNGGHILYGPDGYLYLGLGDGGAANDPGGNGQNKATLLGSILRLDVGAQGPYAIPPDNPFVGDSTAAPEIWSYGWRNPWRFHFDAANGDLWIADVGQDRYEEVNHEPAATGGRNYGWNLFEGNYHSPGLAPVLAPLPGFTYPVAEYAHDLGCSITGGPVYRGALLPDLVGSTLYGDYCSGTIWSLAGPTGTPVVLLQTQLTISSFGLDSNGEVLVLDHTGGRLLALRP